MATLSIAAGAVLAILLGLAIGGVVAWRRSRFAPATEPFLSLLRALRPLLLPLFAVGIVGSAQFPLWGTVAVSAVLALIALLVVVIPEGRALAAAEHWEIQVLREAVHELRKPAAWLIGAVLGLAVVASVLLSTRYFESIGGVPAFLLAFALCLWLAAFLLRMASYASTALRVAIALFVALSGYCLGAAIGILPGGSWLSGNASWLYVTLPAAALVLLLVEGTLAVLAGGAHRAEPDWPQAWRGLGLIVSLLAALFLAISAVVGLWETAQPGEKLSTESAVEAAEEPSPAAPGRFQDDLALAKAYTPVLAFTPDERWTPISVDSYAREAVLSGPLKEPLADPGSVTEKLDRACPRLAGSPCYRLSIRCKDGPKTAEWATPTPTETVNGSTAKATSTCA